MKNFNRRSSHGNHGSKRRELAAQHAHSHGSHAFASHTYIDTVTTTSCEAPAQLLLLSACMLLLLLLLLLLLIIVIVPVLLLHRHGGLVVRASAS